MADKDQTDPQTAPQDRRASERLRHAVKAWTALVGEDHVAVDPGTLARYARTTQASAPAPACVLYPANVEDVQAIVHTASEYGVPLYPISCGKNWGYGDACAPTEGAAIVDLGRMNRIVEINEELAYCVIEPGVTQRQLYDRLQAEGTGLWMDATGAGPDASLIGNALDRGFGHTRYGDHFLTCCGMEIVLADGRVINTGFGHYANAKADRVYPYGVGPYLDGLFYQSNLGIVTQIGLWLMPEPETFNFFYFQLERDSDLPRAIDRLRPLRLSGALQTPLHIGNDLRLVSARMGYPWSETGGETPLSSTARSGLAARFGALPWQGSGSLTGSAGHVAANRRALKKALAGLCRVKFLSDTKLWAAEHAVRWLGRVGLAKVQARQLEAVRHNFDLLKGVPTAEPLLGAQWRLRHPPGGAPGDPLDSGCGLYWISPVLPAVGADASRVMDLLTPHFDRYGFELLATFSMLTERALVGIFNIAFDKAVPEEAARASACYEASVDSLMHEGYALYRCGLQGMDKIRDKQSVFWDVAGQIKQALDPQGIFAPGRYIPPPF